MKPSHFFYFLPVLLFSFFAIEQSARSRFRRSLWALRLHADCPALRELTLSYRGSSDPENIAFILSEPCEHSRSLFGKLVDQIYAQPFAQACNEFSALREMTMHHPQLKSERVALEMIVEGANRIAGTLLHSRGRGMLDE